MNLPQIKSASFLCVQNERIVTFEKNSFEK